MGDFYYPISVSLTPLGLGRGSPVDEGSNTNKSFNIGVSMGISKISPLL
jgi:hypothetical protein